MARIRQVKPEFWTSEQVVNMTPISRLLFIGMWNFCDDGGNHPASAKTLKMEVFPGDDFTVAQIEDMVLEMINGGLLIEYSANDGRKYWHVTGWRHQKFEKPSFKYPKFADWSSNGSGVVGDQSAREKEKEKEKEKDLKRERETRAREFSDEKNNLDQENTLSDDKREEPPPVAPPPSDQTYGDQVYTWAKDNNSAVKEMANKAGFSALDEIPDAVRDFTSHYFDKEAYRENPIAYFREKFEGWLRIRLTKNKTNNRKNTPQKPPPKQPEEFTEKFVTTAFRSRYGSLADELKKNQITRLTTAKNETELSSWMEGMYKSLKNVSGTATRTGPVSLAQSLT